MSAHGGRTKLLSVSAFAVICTNVFLVSFAASAGPVKRTTKGDLTAAQMEAAVKNNPKDFENLIGLADYHMSRHDISDAVKYYNRALKLSPNNVKALETCGKLNMVQQNWRQAADHFTTLGKITPRADVFADSGDAKFLLHENDGAIRDWLMCHKLDPAKSVNTERAAFAKYLSNQWLDGAKYFDLAWQSASGQLAWPLADACLAYVGFGVAGNKEMQAKLIKDVAQKHPADVDLFDSYTFDYLIGKLSLDDYLKKKGNDPYYRAQVYFFSGFKLISDGKLDDGKTNLRKCNMESWAPKDDFKLPFEAVAKTYLLDHK